MFLFHPWSFLLFRNLLDTREMNYWYASLGKEKQGKIRKREGTFVWSKLYKKAEHLVPKEPYTIKRNQTTVVCVVYKLLIMGDSGHTSGFTVCMAACRCAGSCPPAVGNAGGHIAPPPSTNSTSQSHGWAVTKDLGADGSITQLQGWSICAAGTSAPEKSTTGRLGGKVSAGRGPST